MQNGQLKPAYNVQISTENQFITHASIHQKPSDTTTLRPHLDGFQATYQTQSKEVIADAGYGSEENYEMLKNKSITGYVKYSRAAIRYFHKEQKKSLQKDPFLAQNLFYNSVEDFYVCPMGQRMENVGIGKRVSSNGYESQITHYQARNCDGCPLRGQCHQAAYNRKIDVNHRLNQLKQEAKELLTSEKGLKHRSNRAIEPEAVFGQLKSNNRFNRFTFIGITNAEMEFLLMGIGHNLRKMVAKATVFVHKLYSTIGRASRLLLNQDILINYHFRKLTA